MENKIIDLTNYLVPALDKFKLKVKDWEGHWLYAYLSPDCHGNWGLHWINTVESLNTHVDSNTFCQCTGAKESKGKLIYENDYLHVKGMCKGEPVECEKALVRYDEAKLTWMVQLDDHSEYLKNIVSPGLHAWECHVVGNKLDEE